MGASFLYLASNSHLDVIAGAAGFIAGAILVATGLVSLAVVTRLPLPGDRVAPAAGPAPAFATPRVVDRWLAHFRRNRQRRPEPDWQAPVTLAADAVRPLVRSLEQFQLGDGGGPACLIAWDAEEVRASSGGARALVDQWFTEEREHARLLGAAVARFGGRCVRGHWSFTAFCLVRKYLGVRFELTVLLLTEIVSTVYYRLLRRHGNDPALRSMCGLILRDEMGHVAFHRDRLASTARDSGARYGPWWEVRFRALGLMAASVLWVNHAPALRALGAGGTEFYREVWAELTRFIRRLRRDLARRDTARQP
ncbi:MAG TPA: ferritin-like domain-containing protein [Gemmataceae bacterium]|nr:ferritin-like domain-containing protein [Gemmataceae bacterium]